VETGLLVAIVLATPTVNGVSLQMALVLVRQLLKHVQTILCQLTRALVLQISIVLLAKPHLIVLGAMTLQTATKKET